MVLPDIACIHLCFYMACVWTPGCEPFVEFLLPASLPGTLVLSKPKRTASSESPALRIGRFKTVTGFGHLWACLSLGLCASAMLPGSFRNASGSFAGKINTGGNSADRQINTDISLPALHPGTFREPSGTRILGRHTSESKMSAQVVKVIGGFGHTSYTLYALNYTMHTSCVTYHITACTRSDII